MASCGYSTRLKLLEVDPGTCGMSSDYPNETTYVTLKECDKDVSAHLKSLKCSADQGVSSEIALLLARAGQT